ncbi:hypothetical protein RHP75_06725 [Pseudomonas sp. SG20056]|uniref:hypothetical protein n=1 Tax=Pseudomonas sp. SG20056 TaxID=3074146 RepID=UPI00287F5FC0|nr:hypothetical protein [Pseudomonas sp. SG20056]WNF48116.1 hypothetical protein RHP75_06725 [Pseudomonas sp. SG20056]
MDISVIRKRIASLSFVNSYIVRYNNVSSNVVPDTLFTVRIYADAKFENAPLFIVSEPASKHCHIVQNASENLARIIFSFEERHIAALKKADDQIARQDFQSSFLQEIMNHSSILPAKQHLSTIESTIMLSGFICEGFSYLSELYESNKHAKHLSGLLKKSLFAEHTRHEHGQEFVSLVDYSGAQRNQLVSELAPDDFEKKFGISLI